jgi:hypothetical protein
MARVWTQIGHQSGGGSVLAAHVCAAVLASVDVDCAAMTVLVNSVVRETVHATDTLAAELEDLQLTLGEGPGVDTCTDGGPVFAGDLRAHEYLARWPTFTQAALHGGARAVFSLPLQTGAVRLGALDLYRRRPGPLSNDDTADALAFADTAGLVLLDAARPTSDGSDPAWYCDGPVAHPAQVHQATGMVLAQLGVGADAAYARLRAYAYAHGVPLNEVAREVVDRRLRFETDPTV